MKKKNFLEELREQEALRDQFFKNFKMTDVYMSGGSEENSSLDQKMWNWFQWLLQSGEGEYIWNDLCVDLKIEDDLENFWRAYIIFLNVLQDSHPTVFSRAVENMGYIHESKKRKFKIWSFLKRKKKQDLDAFLKI